MFSRKILALLFAFVLIIGVSAPAFAANGYTSGGRGSGSSSGSAQADSERTYVPSSTTAGSTTSTLSSTSAVSAVNQAIANSSSGDSATANIRNAGSVSSSTITAMFNEAAKKNVTLTAHFDRVIGGSVVARLYVTKEAAASLPSNVNVSVTNQQGSVYTLFNRHFSNNIRTVSFDHTGSFGSSLQVAVKLDLSTLNTESLRFYSYDSANNSYTVIPETTYFIDSNGYLHFYTSVGGDIIVTDSPLSRK